MISDFRNTYNKEYSPEKYSALKQTLAEAYNHHPPFRIAETPIFIPNILKERLLEACNNINELICHPKFKEMTKDAIKHPSLEVPGEDYHTRFLQMDFGVALDNNGDPTPQLIEIQGFPSLYFFQDLLSHAYRKHFFIPEGYTVHFEGLDSVAYIQLLRDIIVGDSNPENVVLLEIEPEKQITYIDFLGAQHHLGIKVLCISKLKKRGRQLYYLNDKGKEINIHRIYNRVIFDELAQRKDLQREFFFNEEVDVEWAGHPNWFFRISKFTLPLLDNPYVPKSYYLDKISEYPPNLADYVLKPLYSFAGSGVKLNFTKDDLDRIKDRDNYILQKRISYEPLIKTPNVSAKCEIRMLLLWEQGHPKARIVNNLVRLSKGEMIGVRYNIDKDWVGASVGYFEL
jgi:hypothetical protein